MEVRVVDARSLDEALEKLARGLFSTMRSNAPKKTKNIGEPITITITVSGKKTIAKDNTGRKGVAMCCPEDKFDIKEGSKLAIERMLSPINDKERKLLEKLASKGYTNINDLLG